MLHIAETLGKTLLEVKDGMTIDELETWAAWFELKAEAEKKAMKEAQSKAKRSKPRRIR